MRLIGFLDYLQKIIFSILIFLLPSQLSLHLWPDWAHVFGIRVDYLSPTFYLTDFLILLLFISWFLERRLTKGKKAIVSSESPFKLVLVTGVIFFIVLNIFFAKTPPAAIYKWLKAGEYFLLVIYVARSKKLKFYGWIIKPLMFSLITFSLIAFVQFYLQHTIGGALYFLGERTFNSSTPGIALASILGKVYMRPYSTFSHPNSMAGFYLVGMLLLWGVKGSKKNEKLKTLALFFSVITLVITFSVGSWVAFGLVAIYFTVFEERRGLISKSVKMFFWTIVLVSLLSPFVSKSYLTQETGVTEKISKRLELAEAAGLIFSESPLVGVGLNNFVVALPEVGVKPAVSWWLQPVHNIFLLLLAETGLIGLIVFVIFLWKALVSTIEFSKDKKYITAAFLVILITGLVDHYWLTLQQNQLLFALVVGLSFRKKTF